MIAGFQSRHDISQAAVAELGDLLQQAALSHYSVLQTVNNAPASVMLAPPGDDVDATTTGRYDYLGLLGTGGMGEVRRVLDKDLGRQPGQARRGDSRMSWSGRKEPGEWTGASSRGGTASIRHGAT